MVDFPEPPIGMDPDSPPPSSDTPGGTDPRRQALISSLRQRFAFAQARGDAEAKQALFKEAVYLNLPPELWQDPPA